MDNTTLQTSFIPKQAIVTKSPASYSSGGGNLLLTLSFIILFISILGAGGAFAYKTFLWNELYSPCANTGASNQPNNDISVVDKSCGLYQSLQVERDSLDERRLERMERLDMKMNKASAILARHMSLVPLFDLLSTSTLKTIRYTKFDVEGQDVSLEGLASGYEDIAVQSNILNKIKDVQSPLFSDLNVDTKGNVVFKLRFTVAPALVNYGKSTPTTN